MAYTHHNLTVLDTHSSTTQNTVEAALAGSVNYLAIPVQTKGSRVSVAELKGQRPTQQDMVRTAKLFFWHELAIDAQMNVLTRAYASAHRIIDAEINKFPARLKPYLMKTGSTAATVVVSKDDNNDLRLDCAYLGDSEVFVVTVGEGIDSLTPELHTTNSRKEQQRVEAIIKARADKNHTQPKYFYHGDKRIEEGINYLGEQHGYRLFSHCSRHGSLNVVGGFGDWYFADLIRREPAIEQRTLNSSPARQFVLLACDGLREGFKTNTAIAEFINQQIEGSSDLACEELAQTLAEEAERRGSMDNISVIVAEFTPELMHQGENYMLNIFDGHGTKENNLGRMVAKYLGMSMHVIIQGHVIVDKIEQMSSGLGADTKLLATLKNELESLLSTTDAQVDSSGLPLLVIQACAIINAVGHDDFKHGVLGFIREQTWYPSVPDNDFMTKVASTVEEFTVSLNRFSAQAFSIAEITAAIQASRPGLCEPKVTASKVMGVDKGAPIQWQGPRIEAENWGGNPKDLSEEAADQHSPRSNQRSVVPG